MEKVIELLKNEKQYLKNKVFRFKEDLETITEIDQALQLLQTGVSSSDYRVVEYDGFFQIQKKYIKKENIGFLWWKKEIEKIDWKCVDKYGNFIYSINTRFGNINNYHKKIKDFKDLDSALEKIKVMNNGCYYHYC